jgi:hypothetical protein
MAAATAGRVLAKVPSKSKRMSWMFFMPSRYLKRGGGASFETGRMDF